MDRHFYSSSGSTGVFNTIKQGLESLLQNHSPMVNHVEAATGETLITGQELTYDQRKERADKGFELLENGLMSFGVGGLKGASKTFGPMNPGPLADDVARTFSGGTYTQKVLTEDTIFYRVHGGNAEKVGSYMSRTPQFGGMQSQLDLALKPEWGNTATQVTKVTVPKGTVIYEGSAASQSINGGAGTLLGGGNQVYITKGALNSSWFGK